MRLGEIKNIIRRCLDENNKLFIDYEPMFGNQAYKIKNYGKLIDVFDTLYDQKRNDVDISQINNIVDEIGTEETIVQLNAAQFSQLNSYISALNLKIPLYYSILETMVDDQDEQIINIKLPDKNIHSLKSLSEFNNRLDKLFKQFQIDGQFEFRGLDKGTSWYEIMVVGVLTYRVVLSCLKIAQEFLKTGKLYYESKKAKLDYEASLKQTEKFNEKDFEEYKQKRIDLEINSKVEDVLEKLKVKNGKTKPELQSQILIATKDLIKELGVGTEFHLSLNPPRYAEEDQGFIKIDYKNIEAMIEKEKSPKGLEDSSSKIK